jgi:hypothetical protein
MVMPSVEMTDHLYRYFPQLAQRTISVPTGSVAEILHAVNEIAPGFCDYIVDEHGALRRHVHLAINDHMVVDRKTLSDFVQDDDTVYIFQALTGG